MQVSGAISMVSAPPEYMKGILIWVLIGKNSLVVGWDVPLSTNRFPCLHQALSRITWNPNLPHCYPAIIKITISWSTTFTSFVDV